MYVLYKTVYQARKEMTDMFKRNKKIVEPYLDIVNKVGIYNFDEICIMGLLAESAIQLNDDEFE